MANRRGTGALLAIAVFKLVKAVALIAIGVGALLLAHEGDVAAVLRHLANTLRLDPNRELFNRAVGKIAGLDYKRLDEIGVGTFVYAAVFLVEGIGLILRKRWAEYLTTIVTASFIPLESYEMAHEATVAKGLGLFVNVLIVAYLVVRLRREGHERHDAAPS